MCKIREQCRTCMEGFRRADRKCSKLQLAMHGINPRRYIHMHVPVYIRNYIYSDHLHNSHVSMMTLVITASFNG